MLSAQSGLRAGYFALVRDPVAQATKQATKHRTNAHAAIGIASIVRRRNISAAIFDGLRLRTNSRPPCPRQGEIEWPPALRERGLLCFSRCVRIAPVALATRSSRKDDHHEARSRNAWPRSLFVVFPSAPCAAPDGGAAGTLSRGPAAASARRCDRHRAGKSAAAAGRAQPDLQRRLQRGDALVAVDRVVLGHGLGPLVRREG